MRLDDFARLSPEDFNACCDAHRAEEEARLHDEWARMRTLATITIQPHVKNRVTAESLLPFPWERRAEKPQERHYTTEELRARRDELVRRLEKY